MDSSLTPEFVASMLCSTSQNTILLAVDEIVRRMYDRDIQWMRSLLSIHGQLEVWRRFSLQIEVIWVMVDRFVSIYSGDTSIARAD